MLQVAFISAQATPAACATETSHPLNAMTASATKTVHDLVLEYDWKKMRDCRLFYEEHSRHFVGEFKLTTRLP